MFEITKIRARRIKKLVIYGLAIYGAVCLFKSCTAEGAEINMYTPSALEKIVEKCQMSASMEQNLRYGVSSYLET